MKETPKKASYQQKESNSTKLQKISSLDSQFCVTCSLLDVHELILSALKSEYIREIFLNNLRSEWVIKDEISG